MYCGFIECSAEAQRCENMIGPIWHTAAVSSENVLGDAANRHVFSFKQFQKLVLSRKTRIEK